MTSLFTLLTAALSGVILTCAFAPFNVFPLAILAMALLCVLWLKANRWQAFRIGYAFGVGLFTSGVSWVYISIHDVAGVPMLFAAFITALLVAYLALFPATAGYLLGRYFPEPGKTKILCAFPAIWVFSEWVRSWLFTGFPWLLLGYSQTNSPLKGYAPILGVYGVSLAILFSASLVVLAYQAFKSQPRRALYSPLGFLMAIWIVGYLFSLIPWTKSEGTPLQVSLVQGNIAQTIKWSPTYLQLSLDRYETLTEPLWQKSQLIIWPESAIPLSLQEASDYVNRLNDIAMQHHVTLLMGIPIETADQAYFNSIIALGPNQQVYSKRFLVPFGEFTPYYNRLSSLFTYLGLPTAKMAAGKMRQNYFTVAGVKILPTICYEITYPQLVLTNDKTIGLILTVTNDAWFGKSIAAAQHLQMAAMRALEMKRPVLFVSNTGVTAIVNEKGAISRAIPPFITGVLTATVAPRVGLTPWMQNGMAPVHFILLYLLFIAIRQQYAVFKPASKSASTITEY